VSADIIQIYALNKSVYPN